MKTSPFSFYYECESSSSQSVETPRTPRKVYLRMINQRKFEILSRKLDRFTIFICLEKHSGFNEKKIIGQKFFGF